MAESPIIYTCNEMSVNLRTLVLNANFMPVSVFPLYAISAKDALTRIIGDEPSAIPVAFYERKVLTPSRDDLYWPSVIANFHNKSFNEEVKLSKDSLLYRDHGMCVYCGEELTVIRKRPNTITYDHVIPESKGGAKVWENIVAACEKCNTSKGNKPIYPSNKPHKPTFKEMMAKRRKYPIQVDHETWIPFLPHWEAEVIVKNKGKHIFTEKEEIN